MYVVQIILGFIIGTILALAVFSGRRYRYHGRGSSVRVRVRTVCVHEPQRLNDSDRL